MISQRKVQSVDLQMLSLSWWRDLVDTAGCPIGFFHCTPRTPKCSSHCLWLSAISLFLDSLPTGLGLNPGSAHVGGNKPTLSSVEVKLQNFLTSFMLLLDCVWLCAHPHKWSLTEHLENAFCTDTARLESDCSGHGCHMVGKRQSWKNTRWLLQKHRAVQSECPENVLHWLHVSSGQH